MSEFLSTEMDGGVALIRLDHPPVNAVNTGILYALDAMLRDLDHDREVGAIVITGAGRGFSAGGDTKAMGEQDPVMKHKTMDACSVVAQRIVHTTKPIIGAVHGFAAGAGLSITLACDVTIAEESTRFRLAFRDVGLTPDVGAHHFLAEAIGIRRAKELIWKGGQYSAAEALAWGLVNRVVPDGEALKAAMEEAAELAAGPRTTISYSKQIFSEMQAAQLRQVVAAEAWASALLRTTNDHAEAITAFREKRPPVFGQG